MKGGPQLKVLVIGNGAREHTMAWKLAQSPRITELFVAPGNAGTAGIANNVDVKVEDIEGLAKFAHVNRIDITVVGPEVPLAAGIVDKFRSANMRIFGPSRLAAEIEWSKVYAKDLMAKHAIPCAASMSFSDLSKAIAYVKTQQPPIVLKTDGLAAGKGVIIAASIEEAEQALISIMKDKSFGAAGNRVIIEEHLQGREMSYFVFTDGKTVLPTVPACDYKRIFDNNEGPNTGGMGSYSPPPFFSPALGNLILKTVMEPTILALDDDGRNYRGFLYGGLMVLNKSPKVIEFNARLGDPETQVVLPRLKTDLLDVIEATLNNNLANIELEWTDEACVGVVMASGGYPGVYKTGYPISGLDDVDKDIMVFHAGTRLNPEGKILTSGGRVLTVAALGKNIEEARARVYANISRISFEGCYYRKDIAANVE